jgi:hypothetical protein
MNRNRTKNDSDGAFSILWIYDSGNPAFKLGKIISWSGNISEN